MFKSFALLVFSISLSFHLLNGQISTSIVKIFDKNYFTDEPQEIIPLGNKYAIVGYENADFTQRTAARLTLTNELAEPTKIIHFDGPGNDRFTKITSTANGNLVLGGFFSKALNKLPDAYVVMVDTAGTELWSATYGGSFRDEIKDLIALENGDLIMAIQSFRLDSAEDILLQRTNSSGEVQWTSWIASDLEDDPSRLLYTQSGRLFLTGTYGGQGIVSEVNVNDGSIIRLKQFENTKDIIDINEIDNGENLAILSNIDNDNGEISVITPEGTELRRLGVTGIPYKFIVTQNNDFLVFYYAQITLYKEHSNGPLKEVIFYHDALDQSIFTGWVYRESENIVGVGRKYTKGSFDSFTYARIDSLEQKTIYGVQKPNFEEFINQVVPAPGGGFYLNLRKISYLEEITEKQIIKINEEGDSIWSFKDEDFLSVKTTNGSLLNLPNGNLLHSFTSSIKHARSKDTLYVYEIDPQGNLVWKQKYQFNNHLWGTSTAVSLANGNYLISIYSTEEIFSGFTTTLLRLNPNGDSLSSLQLHDYPSTRVHNIKSLDNGEVLLVGQYHSGFERPLIMKLNQNLEVQWSNDDLGFEEPSSIFKVVCNQEGKIYVSGYTGASFGRDIDSIFVVELSENGRINWKKYFSFGRYVHRPTGLALTRDQNLLISSYALALDSSDYTVDASLLALQIINTSGELLAEKIERFDSLQNVKVFSTALLEDGTLIRVGNTSETIRTSRGFLIISSLDDLVSTLSPQSIGELKLFPQPTRTNFNLEFTSDWQGSIDLTIYNLLGQPLFSRTEEKVSETLFTTLWLNNLPKGNYVLRIQQGRQSLSRIFSKQ